MPGFTGDVELTIIDNGGTVVVPGASTQLVMGTTSTGTANFPVATRNVNTLVSNFGYGPAVEAAALTIAKGGTVIFVKTATTTPGAATAVVFTGTGTSVVTTSGAPYDSYLVEVLVDNGGTIGAVGVRLKISLDGGKSYGPVISLGTAVSYVIANTGITVNFAAGTLVTGDKARFSTTQPLWNTAGVQAALTAFQTSTYGLVGVGSAQLVGPVTGADATTIDGYMTTLATGKLFSRLIVHAIDVAIPAAWGGPGAQTEAQWVAALQTSYGSTDAKRIAATAGHYNMSSQIANPSAGAPRYRRPLSFAFAAREVAIPPQRHAGRVIDGSLKDIAIDATLDPVDGFVYHDERINPGLDAARFVTARTRVKKQGYYIFQPNLMSATGSVFTLLPIGNVMDIACGIVSDVGQDTINEDVLLNKNGTILETEAQAIEGIFYQALANEMINKKMISDATAVVDRTVNVLATSKVRVDVTIFRKGYVLEETVYISIGGTQATA